VKVKETSSQMEIN